MSQSNLVNYTKISPNCTKPRNHNIDTITIHTVAGNATVETLGSIFAPTTRQASAQYGVATDGKIGQYCLEENRSWCSSNAANDHRAITIEVSNDGGEPDWHVSDKALNSLILLLVDICKRNNINKLVWSEDKNTRINHLNGSNMTVHRDFANKSCPGPYLYSKQGYIAGEVNKKLAGTVEVPSIINPTTSNPVTSEVSNNEIIWNFLKSKIKNDYGVAGLMGNLYAESGLISTNLQNSYEKSLGYTDQSYTAAVDVGTYTNFVQDKAGYGLAQWTFWSRKENLLKFAKEYKTSIGNLNMQLNFLWNELESGYKKIITVLQNTTSILEASNAILLNFERPADQSESVQKKRAEYGQKYFDMFKGKPDIITPEPIKPPVINEPELPIIITPIEKPVEPPVIPPKIDPPIIKPDEPTPPPIPSIPPTNSFKSYNVRVTHTALNRREGAGANYGINGVIRDKGIYTIVEEKNGYGRLINGQGWILLQYTERV